MCLGKVKVKVKKEEQKKNAANNKNKGEQTQSSSHEGGSMLADKIFEPLDAILQAYEARLKPN